MLFWKGGRGVESDSLLMCYISTDIAGSNPALSERKDFIFLFKLYKIYICKGLITKLVECHPYKLKVVGSSPA